MSDESGVSTENQPLQFETAEPIATATTAAATAAMICANCKQAMAVEYFELGGQLVCPNCRQAIASAMAAGTGKEPFILATVYGTGAALVGALLWWGVRSATGYEIGLIAVAVGYLVGRAVRVGSRGRGGRRFQILAVLLTYLGITLNYVPDVVKGATEHAKAKDEAGSTGQAAPATDDAHAAGAASSSDSAGEKKLSVSGLLLFIAVVVGIAAAAPFLAGTSNFIGLFIIGFALWEAWKMNRQVPLTISGPFRINAAPAGAVAAAAPTASGS